MHVDTEMDQEQMIAGAWAFLFIMALTGVGAFAITALATWLGLAAFRLVEAPAADHWVLAGALLAGAAALVARRQRSR